MSAQLKSFEGPDVQVLLDRIRLEIGPGAKIDGAQKVRVGGVLGFFAKEHFRVVVEVPDAAAADATAADATGSQQPRRTRRTAAAPTAAPASGPAAGDVFRAMAEATDDVVDIGGPVAAAASATTTASPPIARATATTAKPPLPVPSVESFDAVLTRVATTLENDPGAGAAPPPAPTGPGHRPVDPDPRPDEDGFLVSPEFAAFHDRARQNGRALAAETTAETTGGTGAGTRPGIAARAAQFLAETTGPGDRVRGPVEVPAVAPDPVAESLVRVGLEPALVRSVTDGLGRGGDLDAVLLGVFGALPDPPPLPGRAGSLMVVVGAGAPARRLAAAVAGEIGIDPADVPFASLDPEAYMVATGTLLVRSAEEAAEHAPGWRRAHTAVVVVDAPVAAGERAWATHLIAALRPTAVWGVVDATSKTHDIEAWAANLGGIDALALENTGATVSPAASLALGIPVARLNGQPATAARWVATVVDQVRPCT